MVPAKDPKVTVAASSDSPRNVPVVDSPMGTTEDAAASGLPPTTLKPPGRLPFLEQFNLTTNRYEQVAKVEEMEKKIADLEALIKELKTAKGHDENPEDLLKLLHPKEFKPPTEFGGARKDFLAWHKIVSSMLNCKTMKWIKIIDYPSKAPS